MFHFLSNCLFVSLSFLFIFFVTVRNKATTWENFGSATHFPRRVFHQHFNAPQTAAPPVPFGPFVRGWNSTRHFPSLFSIDFFFHFFSAPTTSRNCERNAPVFFFRAVFIIYHIFCDRSRRIWGFTVWKPLENSAASRREQGNSGFQGRESVPRDEKLPLEKQWTKFMKTELKILGSETGPWDLRVLKLTRRALYLTVEISCDLFPKYYKYVNRKILKQRIKKII